MIRCRAKENFTLREFDKIKNLERKSSDVKGALFIGDEFECDEEMAKYLTETNRYGRAFVEILEVKDDSKTNIYKNDEMCYNKPNKKRGGKGNGKEV